MVAFHEKVVDFIHLSTYSNYMKLGDSVMGEDFDVIKRIPINIDLKDKIWHYDRIGRYC